MKVENQIKIYEMFDKDGNEIKCEYSVSNEQKYLTIRNHWNENNKVVLEIDGMKITVLVEDLHKAIVNATNSY